MPELSQTRPGEFNLLRIQYLQANPGEVTERDLNNFELSLPGSYREILAEMSGAATLEERLSSRPEAIALERYSLLRRSQTQREFYHSFDAALVEAGFDPAGVCERWEDVRSEADKADFRREISLPIYHVLRNMGYGHFELVAG